MRHIRCLGKEANTFLVRSSGCVARSCIRLCFIRPILQGAVHPVGCFISHVLIVHEVGKNARNSTAKRSSVSCPRNCVRVCKNAESRFLQGRCVHRPRLSSTGHVVAQVGVKDHCLFGVLLYRLVGNDGIILRAGRQRESCCGCKVE